MLRKPADEPEETPSRENYRYTIHLPMEIEIRQGLFAGRERIPAQPVDLAIGGAACHVQPNEAFRVGKRYRIYIDKLAGFAEIRNISTEGAFSRLGMEFIQLELETQERIVDAIDRAKFESSRLNNSGN